MKTIKKLFNAFFSLFVYVYKEGDVMRVEYNLETGNVVSYDWGSQKMPPFSGKLTDELWFRIKEYSRLNLAYPWAVTTIYIWAGMEKKHLAYGEPIQNYFGKEETLKTGQGFHWGSGKRYGQIEKPKCPTCGK